MGLGNRRFVVLGVAALGLALGLSGCSAAGPAVEPDAIAIGQQAVGFSSSSAGAPTGWVSAEPCSTALQSEIESAAQAGLTLTPTDPKAVAGPLSDPQMNAGDVATCVFNGSSATKQQIQEFFVGMPQTYFSRYADKLTADGFIGGAKVTPASGVGMEQIFEKDNNRVVLVYTPTAPGIIAVFG